MYSCPCPWGLNSHSAVAIAIFAESSFVLTLADVAGRDTRNVGLTRAVPTCCRVALAVEWKCLGFEEDARRDPVDFDADALGAADPVVETLFVRFVAGGIVPLEVPFASNASRPSDICTARTIDASGMFEFGIFVDARWCHALACWAKLRPNTTAWLPAKLRCATHSHYLTRNRMKRACRKLHIPFRQATGSNVTCVANDPLGPSDT